MLSWIRFLFAGGIRFENMVDIKTTTMTLVKFNQKPLQSSFNNLVDDFFAGLPVTYRNSYDSQWKSQVPVNVTEKENGYSIEVIAPGFDKSDFKISLEQQLLTVSAEKKTEVKEDSAENAQSKDRQIRREYNFRSFKRSFTLDDKTDATNIEATYVNGVLTLNLPKKAEVKPSVKEISVQ
jgi:HSP20 family protein